MKVKHLAITVAVLAVAAVGTAFYKRSQSAPPSDTRVGQPILDPALIGQTTSVVVHAEGADIVLENTDPAGSAWVTRSYYDLPVDFTKLAGLMTNIRDAKITRFASANPDRIERMGFDGTKVELRDKDGKALWSLELGRTVSSGGRFIRFAGEERAYLASLSAWIDATPKNWADAALLPVKPENVVGIDVDLPDGGIVHLKRENATAPWTADGLAEGEKIKESEVSSLLSRLTSLRFSETAEPTAADVVAARENSRKLKVTLADGKSYNITLGRKPAPPAPEKPAEEKPAEGETAAATPPAPQPGPVYVFVESSNAADPINAIMQKRAFQIYEWTYTSLPANRAALVQAPQPTATTPPVSTPTLPPASATTPPLTVPPSPAAP